MGSMTMPNLGGDQKAKPVAAGKPEGGDNRPSVTVANGGMNGFSTAKDLLKFDFSALDDFRKPGEDEEQKIMKPKKIGGTPTEAVPLPSLEELASGNPKVRK